jgi:hypothetical protein
MTNLAFKVSLFILQGEILRQGADGFTSPLKGGVLQLFIALKESITLGWD